MAIRNMELKQKADNASLIAESQQKDREIKNLQSGIQDLRKEVEAQRELTKSVASAGSNHHNYPSYQQQSK
jgi:cell division protein FtsB